TKRFRRTPRHFINLDRRAETLGFYRFQGLAGCRQHRIIPSQVSVSGLTDENMPPSGRSLQAAGQVNFPTEHRVIELLAVSGKDPHQAGCRWASVYTRS